MDISDHGSKAGARAERASRQAGVLFLMSGLLAVVGIPTSPGPSWVLWSIAAADVVVGVLAFVLPWKRWGPDSTAALAVPGWAVLGLSTWAFGGFATGTGPFFVLLFAWLGLHHRRGVILANAPLAATAYAGALVAAGASAQLVSTTVVLIPIAVSVGLIICGRVQLLEREERWRAALIATLAHDVRSPLTTIQSVLEIVGDEEDLPDGLRPLLAAATRQTSRIAGLASSLLDADRVASGRLRLDLAEFTLADAGNDVLELLGKGDVRVDVDPVLRLCADRMRFVQMLVNLTTNALRHGEPPVVISAATEGSDVRISVRDHGAGVPVEDQPFLFERLRLSDRHPDSVGLGLWIVRILAEAHGGGVSYRTVDPGSEFTIRLPAAPTG
ncbi:sensor histidine kinase [Nocardioides gansuensis]|uniref:Sensor-like histidine kinase SenX3 n=1 Tax=Nocardioides gansuensis TaxID=2138300 RepID=A0A2T8FAU9_9ACTN|nr:HAMP domain-containing sensor histidine kinase [Nocardioides gansuensis]PVG82849.1 sensor histidine kinase [Nocardioides gansuensis]